MSIFTEIAKLCDRSDCRYVLDEYGITNAAGHSSGVTCLSCKRAWAVHQPARWEAAVYDRAGKLTNPPPPPKITERKET